MPSNQTIEERLYDRCIETADGCWEFTGAHCTTGYGRIYYEGSLQLTHRVSWFLTYGGIEEGLCVCHKCDNPPCCNPEHLFVGTHKDNETDKKSKGRTVQGERQGGSKLTEGQVKEIRLLLDQGARGYILASRFGVARTTISKIKYNKRWAWL